VSGWASSQYITLTPAVAIQTIERGPASTARVSLTFDAGSDRGNAARILDILASKKVPATFGLTGHWAAANPDLVRRVVNEGHGLMNHTLSHRSFTGYSAPDVVRTPAERLAELFATEQILSSICGRGARPFFRPPYGDYDDGVLNDVAAAGFAYNVMWTVDSLGWDGLPVDDIVYRCLTHRGKGYIYLFHVGSQSADADALVRIIDGLRSHGYRFGTIERLLGVGPSSFDADPATPTPTAAATATPTPTATATRSAAVASSPPPRPASAALPAGPGR